MHNLLPSGRKYNLLQSRIPKSQSCPGNVKFLAGLTHGLAPSEFLSSVRDHFQQIYFEALDNVIQGQPGHTAYSHLEQLKSKAWQGDDLKEYLKLNLV